MERVRFEHGLDATRASTRRDFGFAAPLSMRDSNDVSSSFRYPDADQDEITQIVTIRAVFESARNRPRTFDGSQQCEICMSGSAFPNLLLPARSHHVAVQHADSLPKQERNKKVISLKTISEKLKAWRRHRDAVRELSQLSDHELSDIGIGRGAIEYVARRPLASKASG